MDYQMNAMERNVPGFFADGTLDAGLDLAAYESRMNAYAARTPEPGMSEEDLEHLETAGINLQRSGRIFRTYQPAENIRDVLSGIRSPQVWMLLSEVWCGDSAQSVAQIARIAMLSPEVTLRILLRDDHPDIMDAYLTDGKRSIPKLVVFTREGIELGRWGPRPRGAESVVKQALSEGVPKKMRLEQLHLWYGRNRGADLDAELADLLRGILEKGVD
jgi:hypothetical protein